MALADKHYAVFVYNPTSLQADTIIQALNAGSHVFTEKPLATSIEAIVKTGKPLLMSTGMSTWEELEAAVELIRKYTENFVVLQCTSSYPADFADLNISAIPEIARRFDCLVGYSGHERGVGIAPGTVALGACVIERHFTLDRTMKGPDHAASLEFRGLDLRVKRAGRYHEAIGVPEKIVMESELANRMKNRGY